MAQYELGLASIIRDLQIADPYSPGETFLLRLLHSQPLNPPAYRPITRIMNQEQIHISSQTDLRHALPYTFQRLMDRGSRFVDFGDDEQLVPVQLTARVGPDGFANFCFVAV